MSDVRVQELSGLIEQLAQAESEKDGMEAALKEKNKEIARIESSLRGYLAELQWTEFTAPAGKVSLGETFNIKMPQGEEAKGELFSWMRKQGIYDKYATVHATALKALFKVERELALERGEDPVTFALPGMEPATVYEIVKFKPAKK